MMAAETVGSASTSFHTSEISPCNRALIAFSLIDEAIVIGSRIVVMTAHPGQIRAVIDLPGGRGPDRGDPAFAALEARIGGLIADQIGSTEMADG